MNRCTFHGLISGYVTVEESSYGVAAKVLDYDIIVSKFELQSR